MATLEQEDERMDATDLTDRLRGLLEEHGAAALLRAMSVSARGIAETVPDNIEWLNASLTAEQAAEALEYDDGRHEDDEIGDEDDEEPDGVADDQVASPDIMRNEARASAPLPEPVAPRPEPEPPTPNEGASTMRRDIPTPANVTHWRALRVVEGGENQRLRWGTKGVMHEEFPVRELSNDTIRSRWGSGTYVLYWFGPRDGEDKSKILPMGGGKRVYLVDLPEDEETEPKRSEAPAPAPVARESSGELLAALAAMRPNAGASRGGTDMAAVLQILAFMEDRQDRHARIAEARLQAERDVMLERERLAAKERIAHIEANAQVQARGRGGIDHEALAEAIGRRVQEALTPDDGDDDSPTAASPSELIAMVNAAKDTLAPVLAALVTKILSDPNGLPLPYKPSGNTG